MTWSSWLRLIIGDCWPDWTFWGFTVFCRRRRRRCRRRWVSLKWRIFVTHFDWQFPSHKQQSICNYYDFLRVRQKTKTIFHQSLKQKDDSNGLIFFPDLATTMSRKTLFWCDDGYRCRHHHIRSKKLLAFFPRNPVPIDKLAQLWT
jgi:hypothetical protein